MENSKNMLLIILLIAILGLVGWGIHTKKCQNVEEYLKKYSSYVKEKYELGKEKLMHLFKKTE